MHTTCPKVFGARAQQKAGMENKKNSANWKCGRSLEVAKASGRGSYKLCRSSWLRDLSVSIMTFPGILSARSSMHPLHRSITFRSLFIFTVGILPSSHNEILRICYFTRYFKHPKNDLQASLENWWMPVKIWNPCVSGKSSCRRIFVAWYDSFFIRFFMLPFISLPLIKFLFLVPYLVQVVFENILLRTFHFEWIFKLLSQHWWMGN